MGVFAFMNVSRTVTKVLLVKNIQSRIDFSPLFADLRGLFAILIVLFIDSLALFANLEALFAVHP